MFESVVPETVRKRSRRLFYETLPLSITIHAIAIAGALGATAWQVVFPEHSPRLTSAYSLAALPEPPPPPPPPVPPKAQPQAAPPVPDDQIVAPTVIPDIIPVVEPPVQVASLAPALAAPESGVEGGIEGGMVGGIVGGQLGGILGGPPPVAPDGRVHIQRDDKLPMVVVSQEYPTYPEDGRIRGIEDSLVVRYVIGRDGRVREVTVIEAPKFSMFADATLKAIRGWRFRPLVEEGQKQEVVHELTVYFQLK